MKANIFKNKANLARGFTLIELLVVVSIIGMLASVVLVSLQGARNKAKDIKLIAEVKELQKALELYRLDNGSYPGVGTIYATNGNACAGASALLSTVFDQTFRTKYMPTLPTELVSCGIYYMAHVVNAASGLTSMACAYPDQNGNAVLIHPDGYDSAGAKVAPFEQYAYVFLIKTVANPSNITYPTVKWDALDLTSNFRCVLGPKL